MIRSRVTLAMIEAAAIDRHLASPSMMRCGRAGELGRAVAVDEGERRRRARVGDRLVIAAKVACRILSRSMRSTSTMPTPTSARSR